MLKHGAKKQSQLKLAHTQKLSPIYRALLFERGAFTPARAGQ